MRKIKKDTTLTVGLPTALMLFVALMLTLSAQDVYAWGQFGAAGEFCKTCHTAFSGGAGVAQHDAHASAANYNCTVCHSTASATSIYASPFTSDCTQCHLPQGLRQHHRNAAVHQCFGCHPVPETAAPENTMPPAYAGTGLNPCDGTEELFASFTVGLDNDGDLLYDVDDPDCQAQIEADCTDGIDNDGDGFIDCDDQDCSDQPNCLTNQMEADCADGIDNDGDGFIDCTDTDCFTDPGCQNPTVENCTDGIDNDGDGFTDCADQDCSTDSTCQVTQAENCTDGIDNDGDGFIDCADQDCAADPVCLNTGTNHLTTTCLACHQDRSAITSCSTGTNHVARVGQQAWDETLVELGLNCQVTQTENCTDGVDNDGDGFVDCADQDCSADPVCQVTQAENCSDGIDNDGDGLTDCADQDCAADPVCLNTGTNHLTTTCLACHQDRSAITSCSTGTNHVARVGQQAWDETLVELGLNCQVTQTENCTDGVDNDSDGFVDCADQDCSADPVCQVTQAENCSDGIDNDGDGLTDCADQDCVTDPVCLNTGTNHLTTTCLACHQDRSAITSCSTGTNHVARVGQQAWDETLVELGLNCNATGGGTGGGTTGGGVPADHTDNERDYMHRPGKDMPYTNGCTSCHGSDLTGDIGPSCFSCHGKEWNESAPSGGGTTGGGVPADHTDNERDYMHRPGKDMPYTNGCTSCHGSDLTGDIGPSCFSCHGKEWNESAPSGGGTTGGGVPADHTDNEHDYMHRPGKDMPYTNGCTSCHGSDLTGDIGPSCFSCHGKEWNESAPSSGDIYDGHDSYDSDHVSDDEHDSYYRSYDRDHDD